MALKYMYITRDPRVAVIAENAGVDRIFLDMEYIGKADRQGGMDTVQLHHTVEDVRKIRSVLSRSELMVRVNPWHEETDAYDSSEDEIRSVLDAGADVIMLPYFKTALEVERFVKAVDGRAKVFPLLETPEASGQLDEILEIPGIDEIHIGLNDMSLGEGKKFMFELLADGTVDRLSEKIRKKGIPFGFGGIASPGRGALPAEYILREHYRLHSTRVILARSFCNTSVITDYHEIERVFLQGMPELRELEKECLTYSASDFDENHREVVRGVQMVLDGMNGGDRT